MNINKRAMILAMAILFPVGLAWARPGGGFGGGGNFGGGGGDRGGGGFNGGGDRGGGGWSNGGGNGGNSNNGSTDNSDNNHGHSGGNSGGGGGRTYSSHPAYHNGGWGNRYSNHSYNRSGRYNNYGYHNGWNRPSQGVHHFDRSNNYGGFQGSHNYRGFNNGGFNRHSAISQNLRNMGINHVPRPLVGRSVLPNGFRHSAPGMPHQGPSGHPFNSTALSPNRMSSAAVRTQMATIAGNHRFMGQVAATTPNGALRNHYYWHNWNGYNYCNYWDGYGNCWYGWNCGAGFFWTQYYGGNWWWYDPWWGNWCWWDNGNWWWENPATTTVYVYNNGNYTQADSSNDGGDDSAVSNSDDYGGPVYGGNTPQGQPPADNYGTSPAQGPGNNGSAPVDFLSQDGSVKVTVSAEGDAFLYRMKNDKPSGKPVYLDSNVEEVKFSNSGTKNEKILLIFKDGSFTTINADGSKA